MPRVTVIIPAFNAERDIARAIGSVRAGTETDVEILVADDASTDGTAACIMGIAARDDQVRLIPSVVNAGPGAARNRALAEARGEWVAVLDADDSYHPGRLRSLLELSQRFRADVVSDNLLLCREVPASEEPMIPRSWLPKAKVLGVAEFVERNIVRRGQPRVSYGFMKPVIRRSFLLEHGIRYQEGRFAEDYIFGLSMLLEGATWAVSPEPFYRYTVRSGSLTENHSPHDLAWLIAAERQLLRHPRAGEYPGLEPVMKAHLQTVEMAKAWENFAIGLKTRDLKQAAGSLVSYRGSFAHICREVAIALPKASAKLAARLRGRR